MTFFLAPNNLNVHATSCSYEYVLCMGRPCPRGGKHVVKAGVGVVNANVPLKSASKLLSYEVFYQLYVFAAMKAAREIKCRPPLADHTST